MAQRQFDLGQHVVCQTFIGDGDHRLQGVRQAAEVFFLAWGK
jgi:hypothetical protein